jgi:hypothetical protein
MKRAGRWCNPAFASPSLEARFAAMAAWRASLLSRSGNFISAATGTDAATLHEGSKKCCVAEASPLFGYH